MALTECDALISCFERVVNLSLFHQTALISPMLQTTYDRHSELLDDLCDASVEDAESRIANTCEVEKRRCSKINPQLSENTKMGVLANSTTNHCSHDIKPLTESLK